MSAPADHQPRCDAVPVLPVSDLVRSIAWYERLGFSVDGEHDGYALLAYDDTEVHLAENPSIVGTPSWSGVYLRVPDADLVHARWIALGAPEVGPLIDQPYGLREFATADLDGNLWRVGAYIPGASPGGDVDPAGDAPAAEGGGHASMNPAHRPGDDDGAAGDDDFRFGGDDFGLGDDFDHRRPGATGYDEWYGTELVDGRCTECRLDPSDLPARAIGAEVRDEAHSIAERLRAAGDDEVRVRPSPAVWSALEYGVHVRDVLSLFADRIVRTLRQDRPELTPWDQDAAIADGMANESDVDAVADDLGRNAAKVSEALRLVTDDDWARPATRGGDPCTIESLARLTLHEVVHHRVDIQRLLDPT